MRTIDPQHDNSNPHVQQMFELRDKLKQARIDLDKEFRKKRRKARITDRFCHVMNNTQYGTALANDYPDCAFSRNHINETILQLNKELKKIDKLHQFLINN